MTSTLNTSISKQRSAALTAGISIIIMAIMAGFSVGYAFNALIVLEDATATTNNIKTDLTLFTLGTAGFVFIFICDLLASWGLFAYFKVFDKSGATWMAGLRLIYTLILGLAITYLGAIFIRIGEDNFLAAEVMSHIHHFYTIWSFGLIIFGLHLFFLGYISLRKTPINKIISTLLIIAAIGYIFSNIANLSIENYKIYQATIELIFSIPMIFGELGLGIWLIAKGGKIH